MAVAAIAAINARREVEAVGGEDEQQRVLRAARASGYDILLAAELQAASEAAGHGGNADGALVVEDARKKSRPNTARKLTRSNSTQVLPTTAPPPKFSRRNSIDDLVKAHLEEMAAESKEPPPPPWSRRWAQQVARALYETREAQMLVALLIGANFIQSAVEAQLAESRTAGSISFFYYAEWAFACAFSVELAWNAYAYWWRPFWSSGWNVFDVLIVGVTWVKLLAASVPGVSVLRLFRAFRVLRLFKRIESLRTIIEAIIDALPKVGNAFIVLGVVMGIWSIIAVDFFGPFAPEEFGSFTRAMFTMWQVMTLDGWGLIARRIIYGTNEENEVKGAGFFVSYTFVTSIVLTNVIVAILLDNYLRAIDRAKEAKEEAEALARAEAEKEELEAMREQQRVAALNAEAAAEGAPSADAQTILDAETAARLAPSIVPRVLRSVCAPRELRRLGRAQLLDLAAVVYSSELGRERLCHYAHAKVAGGRVPAGTDAGALLRFLGARHEARAGGEGTPPPDGDGGEPAAKQAWTAHLKLPEPAAHATARPAAASPLPLSGRGGAPGVAEHASRVITLDVRQAPSTPTAID